MSDPKPTAEKADALAKQLKDSLAGRRPRPWKMVLATLVGASLLLGLFAWWLYPRAKPGPLQIIGLDTICTPDDAPMARAQLLVPPDDTVLRGLAGHKVVFHEPPRFLQPGGEKPREVVVKSDERGQASVEWPTAATADFLVVHVNPEIGKASPQERGRIFVWPKDAPLLIVDADETLIADELDAKAAATLVKAEKEGWRIVYLAPASTTAHHFRKARVWIEKQAKLPKGPVLGRLHFTEDDSVESARRELLKQLQSKFPTSLLAIVKNPESAQTCKELNVRTVVIGGAVTWDDVPLKKN